MSDFSMPAARTQVRIRYDALAGVDLSGESRGISAHRSPDCVNMYKKYADGFSDFIETRPGFRRLVSLGSRIYGLWFIHLSHHDECIIHAGSSLYKWLPPSGTPTLLCGNMPESECAAFVFGERLYILAAGRYLVYDEGSVAEVTGTVPLTSAGRAPSGGGTQVQPVNLLTPKRMNSFRGDGESFEYLLDAQYIDADSVSVTVDGAAVSGFSCDAAAGRVTFALPPAAAQGGDDNVVITFSRTVSGATEKIAGCVCACLFDNRVFIAGAAGEPNILRASELEDPCFFSDVSYYADGAGDSGIKALCGAAGAILVFKEERRGEPSVYRHTPQTDYALGRIYPAEAAAVTLGTAADGGAKCFLDDIVFLSGRGLEGLGGLADADAARSLSHRSTLIDARLSAESMAEVKLALFGSYLCLLAGARLYLADGRAVFSGEGGREYEWFVWEGLGVKHGGALSPACAIVACGEKLYFGTRAGDVCLFEGESDDGEAFASRFVTRSECAGDYALRKSVKRRGASALLKSIPNSRVSISFSADGGEYIPAGSFNMGGLDFSALNFAALSFCTGADNVIRLPLDVRDFRTLAVRFESQSRFGLGSVRYNAEIIGYTK